MEMIDGLLMPAGDFGAFVQRRVLPSREILDELGRSEPKRRTRTRSCLDCGADILTYDGPTMTRLVPTLEALR